MGDTKIDTTRPGANKVKDDPKVYQALINGFTKGYTDAEACLAAGISKATLHAYIHQFPEFGERKEVLKKNPILTAKSHVVSVLDSDISTTKWYLERKTQEFKPPDKGTKIQINQLFDGTDTQIMEQLARKINQYLLPAPQDGTDDIYDAEYAEDTSNSGGDS